MDTYPSVFVTLDVIGLAASEAALVHQLRELLLLEFLNHRDSLLQAFLGGTRDVQIKRGVLMTLVSSWAWESTSGRPTVGVAMFLSGR
jgi:hypothetical protein